MEVSLFLRWIAVLMVILTCQCIDQASFYGNSFISIPLKEAKDYTDIRFKFRTHLSDALILLVAGTTDYCILRLDNARLKLNINLGSGEFEIASPSGIKLNNLEWHKVTVTRREANISLTIDNLHAVKKRLPGKFFELNVHYGLFVGGHGNYTDMFFGHLENFRGCLADMIYNGISILERARHRQAQTLVQSVTWNCAAEFDADSNQPISFISDGAFLTTAVKSTVNFILWQLELKTSQEKNAVILYNTVFPLKLDFISLELLKGKIRIILKMGDSKLTEIISDVFVADGHWHKVVLHIKNSMVELSVDSRSKTAKTLKFASHSLEINEVLYVGGVDMSKRTRLTSKGLKIPDDNFKGCMKHVKIGDQHIGLRNARITEGVLNGCIWQFPCLTKDLCNNDGKCVQHNFDSYKCLCTSDTCRNLSYAKNDKVISRGNLAVDLELLILEPLQVVEGQSILITTTNLHIVLDYPKYGISESGVIFHVVEAPEHGNIVIDVWPHEKNSFTLTDMSRDKVYYVHDGSEYLEDHIPMEMEFSTADTFILPDYLQGRFKLILNVNITPVNDPPSLNISTTSVLRLARGTKRIIGRDLLHANDPDSSSHQLVYNVVDPGSGHLEHARKSGVAISSFTQQDVDNKQIIFVHHTTAPDNAYLSLRVSDGIKTSKVSKLRISAFPHYWRISNNTGLVLMHQTSSVITPFNLSFTSNVPGSIEDATYFVIQEPEFGFIESETNEGKWKKTNTFISEDLRRHRVRYRHVTDQPNIDEFQFRTTLNNSATYTFRITFTKCKLVKVTSLPLQLENSRQSLITREQLEYKTEPVVVSAISLLFVINRTPKYGYLFLTNSKYIIGMDDTFTQEDIIAKNINYRLHHNTYSYILDSILYTVIAPGCKNVTGNVTIEYFPSKEMSSKVHTTVNHLTVIEGGKSNITSKHLNIVSKLATDLIFNVTDGPSFGYLQVKEETRVRNRTNFFTLQDLASNRLFYIHDDSESKHDTFHFVAVSKLPSEDFQYVAVFNINILLKNDNTPRRVTEKVFHVVVNGQRLLTGNDLKYSDADLDTTASEIIYTLRELPNGEICNSKNTSIKISEFSQKDLNDRSLIFKHSGSKYGKIKLWVSDGQFNVEGILEVEASAPFIRSCSDKKLITQRGKGAAISNQHLSADTNLFATDDDIYYEVITKPLYGRIVTSQNFEEITNFTQTQINSEQIYYVHENDDSVSSDQVQLHIYCKDAINITQLNIWILPASYWEPLIIRSSCKLWVEESTSAVIDKSILQISQPDDVPASDITYSVIEHPHNGYLSIMPISKNDTNKSANIMSFTQALINENRVVYVQSKSNQTTDSIILNVTNNIVSFHNLLLEIKIIPEHLYLGSNNLNVNEGGMATLSEIQLYIYTEYYKSKVTEYIILQQPVYGWLESLNQKNKLNGFTHKDLVMGKVQYKHDGSENLHDEIVIVGVTDTKRSVPVIVLINILPVNDQKPEVVNNTGLVMWEGGTSVITNSMLATIDADYPVETLRYQVLGCWWGNVSIISEPGTLLQFFTQELIDKGVVVFNHQNGTEAKFIFNVSDGLHSTEAYSFHIKTKPVVLELHERSALHVFPLQKKLLTTENLYSSVSDPSRTIYYRITNLPALGRLLTRSNVKDNIFQVTNKFTQTDINEGKIFYEHTHPFEDLYAEDTFGFVVESHLAPPLIDQKFKIDISISSGGLDTYINIPKFKVNEGGITSIKLNLSGIVSFLENHAGLKSPVIHASTNVPSLHGQVFIRQSSNLSVFTQQQLESGQLFYQHDHSDTLKDYVYLSLYLIPGYIILCNVTIPIEINPINDQPFKLVTPAPHFTVVQGENHTVKPNELSTEDADTVPADIHYDIISGPSEGQIVLLPEVISVSHFSQEDINQGKLIYVHNGVSLIDAFHLRVWDGKFRHDYTVLNIQVIPVSLNASTGLPLYLQQGSNVVLLSHKQFIIETNADIKKVQYIVREGPKHGLLYVKDSPSVAFSQIELDNDDVMYMQTDMTTANDSIKLFAGLIAGNTSVGEQVEVFIKVQPLMQIRNFTVVSGIRNRLSTSVLDATPLAKLTNSNPGYSVTRFPQYGQIRKIIRRSGETRNVVDTVVSSFTHEEVQSGLIYLVASNVETGWDGLQDELHFILAASIFQPAIGKLKITIKSTLHGEIYSTVASPSDPAGREGGMYIASPNMTRDYFLIVSMVVGVIILGVTVIVIIKCRALEPDLNKEEQSLQPIPLPRPPDALMATPSPVKQQVHDGFTSTIPATLPQCKVTPLNESHTRYPYGIEEHLDDWSSCDASDPSCPNRNNVMLRRNQYWV